MSDLKEFYLPVIICLLIFHIQSIDSIRSNQISSYDIKGQYWDGEAVLDLTCGNGTNNIEGEIFGDSIYISNYFKTRVGTVRFRDCQFREIRRKYGPQFNNLHTFNISDVQLEVLKNGTLNRVGRLKKLLASRNLLTEIPAHLFADAISLNSIDLSNNAIKNINTLSFEGAISLTRLNLSSNDIDQRTLEHISIPSLTVLDLSLNPIEKLSVKSFAKVPSLEHLILSRANITSIGMQTFLQQHKLISLNLSGNRLTHLNINLFHRSSLRSLSLNNNQLTELHCVLNSTLTEFTFLDLNNNNFNCTYLKQFMDFVHWNRRSLMRIADGSVNGVKCTKSKDSSASKYNQFQAEFCPDGGKKIVEKISILQATLILIGICILAIVSVVYKRSGNGIRYIPNLPNHFNWKISGSTVQITVE